MKLFPTLIFCLLLTLSAHSQASSSIFLEELTTNELANLIHAGKTTIIIPIGGTEQNGPIMALGKHNLRVKILAEKIAQQLGNALVAPVIAYVPEGNISPPTEHMRFPGTITIPNTVFQKTLEYAARSFKLHGFHTIVFLGDHGGYQKDEKIVAQQLNKEWMASSVRVLAVPEYYLAAQSAYPQLLLDKGFSAAEIGSHAGLADTSLMLALDPYLVRREKLTSKKLTSEEGVYGDPQHASNQLGQLGVDLIVKNTVAAIQQGQR